MNGYDSTREIRQLEVGADIPIIALTAGTIKGERERCLEAGMSDYITKPVISNNIQEMLVKWLSGEKMDSMQIIKNETKNMSFDKNALMERVYDNQEAFEMIVTMMTEFLSDEFPKEFERSLIENDKTGYQFIVHKLKGSASSCCMVNLYYLSVELEKNDSLEGVNFEELKTRTLKEIETCITLLN
jgi:HPt (histidine-containing phosphotransfer) domain-containing protein